MTYQFVRSRETGYISWLNQPFSHDFSSKCTYPCIAVTGHQGSFRFGYVNFYLCLYILKPYYFILYIFIQLRQNVVNRMYKRSRPKPLVSGLHVSACAVPEGGGGGRGSGPPPLENYKNIGFLSNTGPDPFKITKLPIQHSMLGHHRLNGVSLAGRWWPANSGIWILPPSSN